MVLIVITHVQRQAIDGPVVTECFLVEIISVVLLNPASSHVMQTNGKQKREHQVQKSSPTAKVNDCYVISHRACKIDREPTVPHLDRFEPGRTRNLKERKQHQ